MGVVEQARSAWNAVKGDLNPPYDELIESYQEMLHDRVGNVNTLRRVSDDGGILQQFEQVVLEELIPERFHQPNPEPAPQVDTITADEFKEAYAGEAAEDNEPELPKPRKKTVKAAPKKAVKKNATKNPKTARKGAKKR